MQVRGGRREILADQRQTFSFLFNLNKYWAVMINHGLASGWEKVLIICWPAAQIIPVMGTSLTQSWAALTATAWYFAQYLISSTLSAVPGSGKLFSVASITYPYVMKNILLHSENFIPFHFFVFSYKPKKFSRSVWKSLLVLV